MVSIRTAIYGGTFNPIHNAHLYLLREMQGRLQFDRVILIPTAVPPHKVCKEMASGEDRFAMCLEAAKELSFPVEVSDIELLREGKSYTSDTLLVLRELYPEDTFYLLMGEDMFRTVNKWHCPDILYREAVLCAVPRSVDGLAEMQECAREYEKAGAKCCVENAEFYNISSTQVRSCVLAGEAITDLVLLGVARYIEEKGLYRRDNDEQA